MLAEEYGLPKAVRSPLKAAASTFASFVLCGAVPLLPFLVGVPAAFYISVVMTALVFFLIGSTKSRWSPVSWWRSGSETMAIGLGAAVLAFVIGYALKPWSEARMTARSEAAPTHRSTPAHPATRAAAGIGLTILAIGLFTVMDAIGKVLMARYPVPQVVWARYFFQLSWMLLLIPGSA